MQQGSFDTAILNLTNWVGNQVFVILAGLILAAGIYQYSKGRDADRYFYGGLASLLVSGFLRLAETMSQQASGANQYWTAILTLTNYVGNVILPTYAALEVAKLILGFGGVFDRLNIGDDWLRHLFAAMMSLMVSGILREFEHFVTA
jgi:phosphotransferase system  glucose/maltose/N-acetylglucosamine-specific IIC component